MLRYDDIETEYHRLHPSKHYFDKTARKFFNARLIYTCRALNGAIVFVETIQYDAKNPKKYIVRFFDATGMATIVDACDNLNDRKRAIELAKQAASMPHLLDAHSHNSIAGVLGLIGTPTTTKERRAWEKAWAKYYRIDVRFLKDTLQAKIDGNWVSDFSNYILRG
jgi:hypothetical protein